MRYNFEKGSKEKEHILRESLNGVTTVILDPEDEYKKLAEILNGNVVQIDLSNSKGCWINPFTGENSYIEELKEKAKSAIKIKNYRKAYRLLHRAKKLQKRFK